MRYQIFDNSDPKLRLVRYIEAPSYEEARRRAREMSPSFAAAPCPPSRTARESGASRTVALREAALPLVQVDALVRDAVRYRQ